MNIIKFDSIKYEGVVSNERVPSEKRSNLIMLKKHAGDLDYNKFPIMLSEREMNAIDFFRVQQIMTEHLVSPSEAAGLSQDELAPIVLEIDKIYRAAMDNYKNV